MSDARLTIDSVAAYCVNNRLFTHAEIIENGLTITELSRRNRCFKAVNDRSAGYLIKQGIGSERELTVFKELALYKALHANASAASHVGSFVPACHFYDHHNCVLVLEFLRGAETLTEYHSRVKRFPKRAATQLGAALGTLHRYGGEWETGATHVPWALSVLQLPHIDFLRDISGANLEMIKIIQKYPEYCQLLDSLRDCWSASTLIHYDIKWENCIVFPDEKRKGNKLNIIDWELASAGDPCWDVGSIFANYLSYWVLSMPVSAESAPNEFVQLARWPIKMMQPAITAFWGSYKSEMRLDPEVSRSWLTNSVCYAGSRLLQTAFEHLQNSTFLTGWAVCLLQLGFNMMTRPIEAARALLGFTGEDVWATTLSK